MKAKKLNKIAKKKVNADYRKEVLKDYKDFTKAIKIKAKQGCYSLDHVINFNGYRGYYRYHAFRLFRLKHPDFRYKIKFTGTKLDGNTMKHAEFINHHCADEARVVIIWGE